MAATIDDLEARVDALEQTLAADAQSDQLFPNVLTVNPDGSIGANLSGHLHAAGVDLDAGSTSTPPDADRIRWLLGGLGGSPVADLFGYYDGTANLFARAVATGSTDDAFAALRAHGGKGTDTVIAARARNAAHPASVDAAFVQVAALAATILDGTGASTFLQLVATAQLALDHGNASVVWPGASNLTNTVVVPHNLGRIPARVITTISGAPGVGFLPVLNVFARTNANFSVNGDSRLAPAAGAACPFDWIAIG